MQTDFAEELKARGNEAYTAKRYEDALVLYEKALEVNPNNFVYYNNCAAARHELKQYDAAIEAARKSIAIQDNAKAHLRIASALWAQRKFPEAKAEFETALALEPGNRNAKAGIERVEQVLHPARYTASAAQARPAYTPTGGPVPRGGEFETVRGTGKIGLALDAAVTALGSIVLISSLLSPALGARLWRVLLSLTVAQQGVVMHAKGLLQANWATFSRWPEHFCSALFSLCVFALLTGMNVLGFMCMFIVLYAILDLVNRRDEVQPYVQLAGPWVLSYIDQAEAKKTSIALLAASFESLLIFTIMLSGGAIFTLVYLQYGKNRYRTDAYVQLACHGLRLNITRMTRASFLPSFVDTYAQKLFDLIYKLATTTP